MDLRKTLQKKEIFRIVLFIVSFLVLVGYVFIYYYNWPKKGAEMRNEKITQSTETVANDTTEEVMKIEGEGKVGYGIGPKFNLGQQVELFGSHGKLVGEIVGFSGSYGHPGWRYQVDWGKKGKWWVDESEIMSAD